MREPTPSAPRRPAGTRRPRGATPYACRDRRRPPDLVGRTRDDNRLDDSQRTTSIQILYMVRSVYCTVCLVKGCPAYRARKARGRADPARRRRARRRVLAGDPPPHRRAVHARRVPGGIELRLARVTLFRFGPPRTTAIEEAIECRFPIVGGLLAKEEGRLARVRPASNAEPGARSVGRGLRPTRQLEPRPKRPPLRLPADTGARPRRDRAALPRTHGPALAMRVAILGASGVIGSTLVGAACDPRRRRGRTTATPEEGVEWVWPHHRR